MPAIAKSLGIVRLVTLSVISVFSFVVLGVNAHYLSTVMKLATQAGVELPAQATAFSALGLAVAVVTIVTLPAMIIVDLVRKGAFTSIIAVEFGWLGFLDIMWIASAGYTTSTWLSTFSDACAQASDPVSTGICTDLQASMAFSWLNWISLTAYYVTLLVFCIIAANKGSSVWTSTIKTANWPSEKGYPAASDASA